MMDRVKGDSHQDGEPDSDRSDDSIHIPIWDDEDEDMRMDPPEPIYNDENRMSENDINS